MSINWTEIRDQEYMATVGYCRLYAGIDADGAVYWSNGNGAGHVGKPNSWVGIKDPMAYANAAIARAKADAEAWASTNVKEG